MSSPDGDSNTFQDPSILTEESPDQRQKVLMAAQAAKAKAKGEPPVHVSLSEFKYEIERQ